MKKSVLYIEIILILGLLNGLSMGNQLTSTKTSSVNNDEIFLNDINVESSDFFAKIYFVGTSSSILDKLSPALTNVYEIKSNLVITPIVIKFNVSGFTSWNLGNVSIPYVSKQVDFGINTTTIGQVFIQIDNLVYTPSDPGVSLDFGFSVPVSQGDHTISVLYIGYGEDGIQYAHDSIVMRISTKSQDILPYVLHKFSLTSTISELHQSDKFKENIITNTAFNYTAYVIDITKNEIYLRNDLITPSGEINFGFDNGTKVIIQYGETHKVLPQLEKFTLEGFVNTTGITGLQIMGEWMTQPGITFFVDANGLHSLDEVKDVYLQNGNNFVGVFTLAPYGMWHKQIPYLDGSKFEGVEYGLIDWELRWPPGDSSFDYMSAAYGVLFNFAKYNTVTSVTKDSPGLLLLGTISTMVIIMILHNVYKNRRDRL